MGRIKEGFKSGNIVVCINTGGTSFLTLYKEYEVIFYTAKISNYLSREGIGARITIETDLPRLKKLLPCDLFMPKSKYQSMVRDNKISNLLR